MKGHVIVIESGTDGSGKKVQAEKLYERLVKEGHFVKMYSFPNYKSDSSALVKMYLSGQFGDNVDDIDPYIASTFYSVDRFASYLREWKKCYEEGCIILLDRYTTSNMIHQGSKLFGSEKTNYLAWLDNFEYEECGLPRPSKVILLDVPPKISADLRKGREIKSGEEIDIHEKDNVHMQKSYETAKQISETYDWDVIDCMENGSLREVEDIHNEVYEIVKKIIVELPLG